MKNIVVAIALLIMASGARALDRTVTFTWEANAAEDNIVRYDLYKSNDNVNYSPVSSLPIPSESLELSDTLSGGTGTFYYHLTASNAWGESGPSNVVNVNTSVPAAPTTVRVQVIVDVSVNNK